MRKLVVCIALAFPSSAVASAREAPSFSQARAVVHSYSRFARIIHMRRTRTAVRVVVRETWHITPEGEATYRTESRSVLRVYWRHDRLLITNVAESFALG